MTRFRPTHCKRGHPFDETNLRVDKRGYWRCRRCQTDWQNEHNRRVGYTPQRGAQERVRRAIRRGVLTPAPCHCGSLAVEAHHHKGYDHAHRLDVVWLCRQHHSDAHRFARLARDRAGGPE
jgi:hypothetical protein